ncbi:MAG: hypothetical protein LBU07_00825 [Coriobacteriales bacterium]|jgi:hypothetical protein|nr:hypothetical protein [Coriobacteriales bacterium]
MTALEAAYREKSQMVALEAAYRENFLSLGGDIDGRLAAQSYLNASSALYHDRVVGMGFLPKIYDRSTLAYYASIAATTYTILDKITTRYVQDPAYRQLFGFSHLLERLICLPTGYDCAIPMARLDLFFDEHSGNFKFCEFNTDGSSAMNEDREIVNALATSRTFQRFSERHALAGQELFDNWVQCFLNLYQHSAGARTNPTVAIVDYRQSATLHEHLEFQRRFTRCGIRCLVADMASLHYQDGRLFAEDSGGTGASNGRPQPVDAVYRRAVTAEIVAELEQLPHQVLTALLNLPGLSATPDVGIVPDTSLASNIRVASDPSATPDRGVASTRSGGDSGRIASFHASPCVDKTAAANAQNLNGAAALVAAVAEGAVCMIGGFRSQVAHSKAIFTVLHLPQTSVFLSATERQFVRRTVPYTTWLSEDAIDLSKLKANKNDWIIKPVDGYGTVGVFAGKAVAADEWDRLIDTHRHNNYIVQEYCRQFPSLNTLPVPKDASARPLFSSVETAQAALRSGRFDPLALSQYNILTGLFCYGGQFAGNFVRAGQHALIVGFQGGISLGVMLSGLACEDAKSREATRALKCSLGIGASTVRTSLWPRELT